MWSVLTTCKNTTLLILTQLIPYTCFPNVGQYNMKFWGSVVQRKIYCSNSHPLIWEPLPLPPWWRPDIKQAASEADDLGLFSSDCFSRDYRLAYTMFYRAKCLHGHLSRYLIHNPDKEPEAKGSFSEGFETVILDHDRLGNRGFWEPGSVLLDLRVSVFSPLSISSYQPHSQSASWPFVKCMFVWGS